MKLKLDNKLDFEKCFIYIFKIYNLIKFYYENIVKEISDEKKLHMKYWNVNILN